MLGGSIAPLARERAIGRIASALTVKGASGGEALGEGVRLLDVLIIFSPRRQAGGANPDFLNNSLPLRKLR